MTLRGAVFAIAFHGVSILLILMFIPLTPLPDRWFRPFALLWLRSTLWTARHIGGITWSVEGREHLPTGPFLLICKHQSAWETLALAVQFDLPAFVLKHELIQIPVFGLLMKKTHQVVVDRSAGMKALKNMVADAKAIAATGRVLIVFPEGTRTPPGEARRYLPGAAVLYSDLDLPCIPAALNSGSVWPKKTGASRPGHITLRFLKAIPPGLTKREFLTQAAGRIEAATRELENRVHSG